jgi:hypothetical protein
MAALNDIPQPQQEASGPADKALKHLPPALDEYGRRERTPSFNETEYVQVTLRTDAAIATGHALLAIHQELGALRVETAEHRAAVCHELADVAAAVRELAAAVMSVGGPLTTAVQDLADSTVDQAASLNEGLDDIADAVDALTDGLKDRPRWSWRDRLRRRPNRVGATTQGATA